MKHNNWHTASGELVASLYDNLFKTIVCGGWNIKSDGDVESPSGFFALVEIPKPGGELDEMSGALELDEEMQRQIEDLASSISTGWFVTHENSDGLIFVYEMPSELAAKHAYSELEAEFAKWDND
jgi:hypothetical protein